MKTYRVDLIDERDGTLFAFKEFEARDEAHAEQIADRLNGSRVHTPHRLGPSLRLRLAAVAHSGRADR